MSALTSASKKCRSVSFDYLTDVVNELAGVSCQSVDHVNAATDTATDISIAGSLAVDGFNDGSCPSSPMSLNASGMHSLGFETSEAIAGVQDVEDDDNTQTDSVYYSLHASTASNCVATIASIVKSEQEKSSSDIVASSSSVHSIDSSHKKISVKVGPQHFDLLKLVGEGAFGKVILVRNVLNNQLYAMKVISKKLLKKKSNIQYMKSERDILTKLNHPFIVSLRFAFQTEQKLFLVMDFLSGGELFFHLKRRGLMLEIESRFYFSEMILAIEFLHGNGIIHRDLKPENVLLRGDGHICLTDFGLAKEVDEAQKVRTLCGTSEYMAPEMISRNGYSKSVDWWSLGALFFEMLTGSPPFQAKTQKELDKKIMTEKLSTPSYLTAAAHSLLKGLLEKDINKRLGSTKSTMFSIGGVSSLKQHPYFEGLDWVAVSNREVGPPDILSRNAQEYMVAASQQGAGNSNTVDINTMHFHEGFTTQHISLSVVEEYSSTSSTPQRSRSNSESLYNGFEYAYEDMQCTEEEMRSLEVQMHHKQVKANKKRSLKDKKDKDKQAEDEKRRIQKDVEDKERALNRARVEQEQQEALMRKEQEEEEARRINEMKTVALAKVAKRDRQLQLIAAYADDVSKVSKKLKALRKKLRDILDLRAKYDADVSMRLSPEQKEKLRRRKDIEDEIVSLEVEEKKILSRPAPEPLPLELLEIEHLHLLDGAQKGSDGAAVPTASPIVAAVDNIPTTPKVVAVDSIPIVEKHEEGFQVSTGKPKRKKK